jgi:hypothetical protein
MQFANLYKVFIGIGFLYLHNSIGQKFIARSIFHPPYRIVLFCGVGGQNEESKVDHGKKTTQGKSHHFLVLRCCPGRWGFPA